MNKPGQRCPGLLPQNLRKDKAMKILALALLQTACLAFVLGGCTDNSSPSDPTTTLSISDNPATPLSKQGPKIHSVTGSAHTIEPSTGKSFEYTVNALDHGGSSFSGQYQLNVHGTDPFYNKLHGKVMSLKIWDGNKAVIGGIETNSGFVGSYDALVVVDNGEGGKASGPDMVAVWLYYTDDLATAMEVWSSPPNVVIQKIIELHPDLDLTLEDVLIPVAMGNIDVR
jgi:hypothetical protein